MNGDEKGTGFEGWAIVELFGHKRMAGYVSSQEIAGGSLVRIDVPATEADRSPATAEYTKLVGVAAIYGITPCTEEVARRAARAIERYNDPIPVSLPALPAPRVEDDDEDDEPELEFDDEDMEPGERARG